MTIIPLKSLQDNYIWVIRNHATKQAIIVDPGDAAPVLAFLNAEAYSLAGILVTHHHGDHTAGIEALVQMADNITVAGSHLSPNRYINHAVKDGDTFTCADIHFKALAIPGHTLDHTAFYIEADNALFTGDTLFSAGCGRIFEGTPNMMLTSLQKLAQFADHTKIYCGHEYTKANLRFAQVVEPHNADIQTKLASLTECTLPSTLGDERLFNPFLRYTVPNVIHAAEHYAGKKLHSDTEVFATLREWKNHF